MPGMLRSHDHAGYRRHPAPPVRLPRSAEFLDIPCDTPEVDTRRLDALVLENLIANVITDDLLSDVIHQVQQDAANGASPIVDHDSAKPVPDAEQRETVHWETPGGSPVTNEDRYSVRVRVQPAEPVPCCAIGFRQRRLQGVRSIRHGAVNWPGEPLLG